MIVIHLKVQGTESAVLLKKKKKSKGIMRDKTSSLSKNKKNKKKRISAASVMLGNQCNFGEIFRLFFRKRMKLLKYHDCHMLGLICEGVERFS